MRHRCVNTGRPSARLTPTCYIRYTCYTRYTCYARYTRYKRHTRQAECEAHPNLWDQNLFKDVLKIGGLRFVDKERPAIKQKRLFLCYNGTIAIGILPINTFCSGHTYFVQRMPQKLAVEPYSVHTTFQAR